MNPGPKRKFSVHSIMFGWDLSAEPTMTLKSVQALDLVGAPDMGRGRSKNLPLPMPEVLVRSQQSVPSFWPDLCSLPRPITCL